jgi:DNA topoisomerase-1
MGSTINKNGSLIVALATDPVDAAERADLRYVSDDEPGIKRRRCGRGFTYIDAQGKTIRDPEARRRFNSLAIPPAWADVWICAHENGHIQVTGRDDKGRKQYIYHPRWQEVRNQAKFNRLLLFGESLPQLRAQIDKDLRRHGLPRERVVAAVVRLLEETLIRVGNEQYARQNESYGLTTMRNNHVDVTTTGLHFDFRGKSGKEQHVDIRDPRTARVVRQCQELPGQELFKYIDEEGNHQTVGSADVNEYLYAATGKDFTAKDFRTWGGTVAATRAFQELGPGESERDTQKKVVEAVKMVAEALGNTAAVCRDYYIHPAVISAYQEKSFFDLVQEAGGQSNEEERQPEEQVVLHLLRHHLAQETQ